MKKTILSLTLICSLFGCSKEKSTVLIYPKTNLPNTTWKATLSTTQYGSNLPLYEFLQFIGSDNVKLTVGISLSDPTAAISTYPCTIVIDPTGKNMDSFDVTYTTGKVDDGFTTNNVNQLTFQFMTFNKVD